MTKIVKVVNPNSCIACVIRTSRESSHLALSLPLVPPVSRELCEDNFRFLFPVCVFVDVPGRLMAEDVVRGDITGEDGTCGIRLLSSERFRAYVPKNLRHHL
jgi:hypothetical protein